MAERNASSDVDESDNASDESDTQEEDEESLTEVASSLEGPNGTLPSALEMVQQSIALVKADIMILSICIHVNTCAHCTHSVHRCSQFTFSSALFDTNEQWFRFLHIMHKRTCGWVDND